MDTFRRVMVKTSTSDLRHFQCEVAARMTWAI